MAILHIIGTVKILLSEVNKNCSYLLVWSLWMGLDLVLIFILGWVFQVEGLAISQTQKGFARCWMLFSIIITAIKILKELK